MNIYNVKMMFEKAYYKLFDKDGISKVKVGVNSTINELLHKNPKVGLNVCFNSKNILIKYLMNITDIPSIKRLIVIKFIILKYIIVDYFLPEDLILNRRGRPQIGEVWYLSITKQNTFPSKVLITNIEEIKTSRLIKKRISFKDFDSEEVFHTTSYQFTANYSRKPINVKLLCKNIDFILCSNNLCTCRSSSILIFRDSLDGTQFMSQYCISCTMVQIVYDTLVYVIKSDFCSKEDWEQIQFNVDDNVITFESLEKYRILENLI